jgi:ABC-type transport system substrate-binding protein
LFTFQTIQQPGFPNSLLQQNFRGVTIAKIDERTVTFTLSEPYSFFPSNLTLGLIPKKSFEGIPVTKLDQVLDFAFKPIGAGPYKVKTIVPTELSSEVTLERFERPFPPNYRLDRVVFRIFSDYATLLSDLRTLQGVRLVPRNKNGEALTPRHFVAREYTLPQYVALFFNLSRTKLQDGKLRLGLQLGTNKQAIVDDIQETHVIDTPLLEIDASDWRYQFDSEAAKG